MNDHILQAFEAYAQLPTPFSPSGMPASSKRILKHYLSLYVEHLNKYQQPPTKQNFAGFLASLKLSNNFKSVLCHRLGKFLRWENFLSEEDFSQLRSLFKFIHNDWSTKALGIEIVPRILNIVHKMHKHYFTKTRDLLLIYTMATVGCRVGQITRTQEIVESDNTYKVVYPKLKFVPKPNSNPFEVRFIPSDHHWGNFAFADLYFQYVKLKPDAETFFVTNSGKTVNENYVRQLFQDISETIGTKITPHTIRHTVGTYVANKYGVLQANLLLGHARIETTQKYINKNYVNVVVPSA